MKRNLLALSIAAIAGTATAGTVTTDGPDLVIGSKGDLSIETADGNFSFDLGGRLMWDNDFYDGIHNSKSHDGERADDSELRRSRLTAKGTVYKDWHYKLQYTFNLNAGDKNQLEDAYIKYTGWDFADITIGKYKIPFGLEELISSKHISTIERAVMFEFVEASRGHRQNLQLSNGGNNYSWAVGLFEQGEDENGAAMRDIGGRVTFAPIAEKNQVVHLGAAFLQSDIDSANPTTQKFENRLAVHTADKIKFADSIDAEDHSQYGLEAAWMTGPFSIQSEYVSSTWEDAAGDEVEYTGYYAQATWSLTGESRSYKAKKGYFDKIKPAGANGAWELVAKIEHGEVDDGRAGMEGNEFDNITVGVNWYANKNVRVSVNYVMSEIDTPVTGAIKGKSLDDGDAISTRVQLAW